MDILSVGGSRIYEMKSKAKDNEDVHDLGYVETEFPAIVFNDTLTSEATLSCEPTVSSLNNNEIDFRISFDESNDEDCTIADATYSNPMDMAYSLSGYYPVFIFSTVYTTYSLNEYDVYRVMDLKLCYNTFKFKEELEINTGFINGLPKKWLAFCQSLINTNHVKESELPSLFGKLKYEENLIDSIYGTNKEKILVSATLLSTAFFFTSIVQDFQDSPDDEEDTRSNQEKGHFPRDCFLKTSVPSYQSPFQTKLLKSFEQKPALKHTKYFEAKYNKVKANLALLSFSASASNSYLSKNKGLHAKKYEWDEEEVSLDENEGIEVKALMALADDERVYVGKENESSVCSTPLSSLEKLVGAIFVSGLKTIKSILKSNSTFKTKTLKGVIINEPSSAPAKVNISTLVSKTNSAPAGKLKNVKMEDDPPLAIVMKELNELKFTN
uniref:Retrovirus-related Pol polyprotein from transposon TNT 1-94 n=1 Tax=Tanacetum cinerariifolium TaxID=118510 RepID=A0A6L2KGW9_TANCI|nr:hypothetical protein [Tanacetum cinerariifolium]